MVRVALAIMIAIAAFGVAESKPRLRDLEPFDGDDFDVEPCGNGKTWAVVERCMKKQGNLALLHQTETVRIVRITSVSSPAFSRLHLYTKTTTGWVRGNLNASTNATVELLGVSMFHAPGGDGIQLAFGSITRQSVSLDQTSATKRAVVRRVTTHVCLPDGWSCRAMVTDCEVYVDGKAYWTFHGEMFWHPSLGLRIRGSAENAGTICKPPRAFLIEGE